MAYRFYVLFYIAAFVCRQSITRILVALSVAWLIGWALILEYTIGGSAVARGISPNLALFFGGKDKLPAFLARHAVFGIVVDPCAALLIFIVTGLLLNGMLSGSATVFFSYIGFDAVTSTAEEVKNPQRDLPLGIGIALSMCCILYMLASAVIVGLVPYYALDPDTPISSAFASYGMGWAVEEDDHVRSQSAPRRRHISSNAQSASTCLPRVCHVTVNVSATSASSQRHVIATSAPRQQVNATSAVNADLSSSQLGFFDRRLTEANRSPRTLMAMARDGLLPSFFSDINKWTHVPVKSTVVTGIFAAALAFFMDVSQLAGMVSVGTLLAFTVVAISILILRYVPPDEVPPPSSLRESSDSVYLQFSCNAEEICSGNPNGRSGVGIAQHLPANDRTLLGYPLIHKEADQDEHNKIRRRKIVGWNIALVCIGILVVASAASAEDLSSLIVLACMDQDVASHSFGHTGGFICPFVPLLPVACILIIKHILAD
ncbi:hypothetical protein Vadar_012047 [Vaccinium darrowii]|uniref:Uncharacterized protein n=1 Tax=Vaccinium darrowii TaxID=229202 RepID=A0ACB7YM80_9ERIC|nr:hypothetical protein Vadar_012047 [Vaccinium darrowii]